MTVIGSINFADALPSQDCRTVIGPAVNVTRIEALCEPLRNTVLVSAEFAAALGNTGDRLISLGHQRLRGVRQAKEFFAPAPSSIS